MQLNEKQQLAVDRALDNCFNSTFAASVMAIGWQRKSVYWYEAR